MEMVGSIAPGNYPRDGFITGMDAAFTGMPGTEDRSFIFKILVNVVFVVAVIAMIIRPYPKNKAPKAL